MKKVISVIFATYFLSCLTVFGQTPLPTPPVQENEDVIRISSSLVQTDFIVLDKDGKQVRDLKASDIEIFQDGKPQEITNFSYIIFAAPKNNAEKSVKNIPPVRSAGSANRVGRLLTFVIDDGNCNASPLAVISSKDAIADFIKEQMQSDDRAAIYQTKGGSNLLQQYTSNKEQLLRTVKKIRYFPPVFGCGGGVFGATTDTTTNKISGGRTDFESEGDRKFRESNEDFNRESQLIGTAGVLDFIVERLKPVEGRKIVFFLSDGIQLRGRSSSVMRKLADNASRSSVVFNTMDARGLIAPGFSAEDKTARNITEQLQKIRDTQSGLIYLAEETGGSYYINQNKLETGIRKILEEQSGYYLIGYQPDDETFKDKDFHKIEVKVKNPDYKVTCRSGFYGIEDKPRKAKQTTAESPLYQAITAPIQENGIDSRLTTLYYNDVKKGNFVRTLLHLNGRDLTLIDEPNGTKKLSLDVVAVTLDEKNKVVGEFNRTNTIYIPNNAVDTVLENGFVYSADIPLEKNGAYSFRIAVRDKASNRLASAGDFVQVPDAKKFYMSGLITAEDAGGTSVFPSAADAKTALSPVLNSTNSAVRQFSAGNSLIYAYTIYNPKIDKQTKKPDLTAQILLYRDGNLIVEAKEQPIGSNAQTDLTRIYERGSLKITPSVQIGEYILQIVVKDKAANKTTTQFVDFEVVQ